jgi:hypothetical protein
MSKCMAPIIRRRVTQRLTKDPFLEILFFRIQMREAFFFAKDRFTKKPLGAGCVPGNGRRLRPELD